LFNLTSLKKFIRFEKHKFNPIFREEIGETFEIKWEEETYFKKKQKKEIIQVDFYRGHEYAGTEEEKFDENFLWCPIWWRIENPNIEMIFLSKIFFSFTKNHQRLFVYWINWYNWYENNQGVKRLLDNLGIKYECKKVPYGNGRFFDNKTSQLNWKSKQNQKKSSKALPLYDFVFECDDYLKLSFFLRDYWSTGYNHFYIIEKTFGYPKIQQVREHFEMEKLELSLPDGCMSLFMTMPDWTNLLLVTKDMNRNEISEKIKKLVEFKGEIEGNGKN